MEKITVSIPDDLIDALSALRAQEEFKNFTYSELLRLMLQRGLEVADT